MITAETILKDMVEYRELWRGRKISTVEYEAVLNEKLNEAIEIIGEDL